MRATGAIRSAVGAIALSMVVAALPAYAQTADDDVEVAGAQSASPTIHCADWGDSECVPSDYTFDPELHELARTAIGLALVQTAARTGVTVARAAPDAPRSAAAHFPADNSVRLGVGIKEYPLADRLAMLTHELQHAADAAEGLPLQTPAGCYATEENAITAEIQLWTEMFAGDLPAPRTAYEAWLNSITRSPTMLAGTVTSAYRGQCDQGLAAL